MLRNKSKLYKKIAELLAIFMFCTNSIPVYATEKNIDNMETLSNDEACGVCWYGTMKPIYITYSECIYIGTVPCTHFPHALNNPQDKVEVQNVSRTFKCTYCGHDGGTFTEVVVKKTCLA